LATKLCPLSQEYAVEAAAFKSIRAGADMILSLGTREVQATQANALAEAIDNGAVSTDQVKASLKRLEEAVARFSGRPRPYTTEQLASDQALMQAAARYSITSFGSIQRPKPTDRVLLVSTGNPKADGPYGEAVAISTLAGKLMRIFPNLSSFVYLDANPSLVMPKLKETIEGMDFVLLATVGRSGLSEPEAELLRQAFDLGKPALHLALWNPYHVAALRKPALITYGFREPTLDALVEVLSGEEPRGKLPAIFPVLGRGQ
jgi:beta-N-acetylhexosaminidase